MKHTFLVIAMLISLLYSQDYLNVQTNSGYKHELISNMKEITFDGDNINFELNSGTIATESMDDIINITFGESALGEQSLPVELTYFNATIKNGNIFLNWETGAELNNYGFEIERLHDNISDWKKLGFVDGKGNSSTATSYNFTDKNASAYSGLKYRLKQIDNDGSFEYSEEISVTMDEIVTPNQFILHENYPNPFNPVTTISYELVSAGFTTLIIYDIRGNKIHTLVNEKQEVGIYTLRFAAEELPSGVYICNLTSENNSQLIKMLLMK